MRIGEAEVLVDSHSSRIMPAVWDLFKLANQTYGIKPAIIEWDNDLPTLEKLCLEAWRAESIIKEYYDAANAQADFIEALLAQDDHTNLVVPAANLAIYRNNVNAAIMNALKATYPLTLALLGKDFFAMAAREYMRQYPHAAATCMTTASISVIFSPAINPCMN